jgi:fibronectin-binding autotransporter adhesin
MPKLRITLRKKLALTGLIASAFAVTHLQAQTPTQTWTSATTGNWATPGNWLSNSIATSASTTIIEFQGSGSTAAVLTNDLPDNPFLANGFVLNSTNSVGVTIAGINPFQFVVDGANNPFINQNNTGAVTITAPIDVTAPLTFGGSGAGAVTLSGLITGTGAMTKTSSGTLSITGQNTNTAGITVSSGTLLVSNNNALTGSVALDNSTSTLANGLGRSGVTAAPITLGNGTTLSLRVLGDNGTTSQTYTYGNALTVSPGATTTLDGNRNGTLATNKILSFGALTLGSGSTLNHAGANSFRFLFNGLNVDTAATINVSQSFMTVNGAFAGTGLTPTLTKLGATDLTLGATSSSLDTLNVSAQRVFLTTANWGTTKINVAAFTGNGTSLNWQGATGTLSNLVTVTSTGGISNRGTGLFTLTNLTGLPSAGTLELNNDDASTGQGISLSGNYPTLTNDIIFKFSGARFGGTVANSIGSTAITGTLDVGAAPRIITMNYTAATASTTTPATTSLLNVGNLVLTSNATINGSGSGTLQSITGSGVLTFSGTQILYLNGGATSSGSGGVTLTSGLARLTNDSTVTAGALAGGPLGTGTLTLNTGSTIQDNLAPRTVANSVVIAGNTTFSTSGTAHTPIFTGAGRLTFDDTGLTSPSTITINAATNPTLTVNTLTTFNEALSVTGGATGFTKAGTGKLVIGRSYSNNINVTAGTLTLHPTLGLPVANLTMASGTYLQLLGAGSLASDVNIGSGVSLLLNPVSQAILDSVDVASTGVVALGIDSSTALDFSAFTGGLRLGAAPAGFVYSGTLTPAAATYRLGGGGGTLLMNGLLTGVGNSLDVGLNGTAVGEVVLNNAANSFDGGTTLAATSLVVRNDGSLGATSSGVTSNAAGATLTLFNNMTLAATRTVNTGTFATSIANGGFNVTLANAVTGTGALTLSGTGTTTITGSLGSTPVVVAAPTMSALTGSPLGTGAVTLENNLTLTGTGNLTIPGNTTFIGGTLSFGSGVIGQTLTLGGTLTKGTRGVMVLAPVTGIAAMGTAGGETILVGGTAPALTNGMVLGVIGRDTAANGNVGTFLTYGANGFVPTTYGAFGGATPTVIGDITTAATQTTAASNQALRISAAGSLAINPPTLNTSIAVSIGSGGLILNGGAGITQTANGTGVGQLAFGANEGLIYASGASTISAVITGTNGLVISGPGSVALTSASNSFTGSTISVHGGTLAFAGFADTTTTTTNTFLGAGGARTIVLDAGGTLRLTSGTFNPVGSGKLLNVGAGGGTLDIRTGGTYQVDDAGQLVSVTGTAGPLTLTNGGGTGNGLLLVNTQNFALNGPVYLNAAAGGTSTLRITGGSLTSTLGNGLASAIQLGANGIFDLQTINSRAVVLNGGSLAPSGGTATQNGLIYSTGGGTLGGVGTTAINGEVILDSAGVTLAGAGNITVNSVITGSGLSGLFAVTKTGTGIATLISANTYTGPTSVQAGVLSISSDSNLGTAPGAATPGQLVLDGGTLRPSTSISIQSNRGLAIGNLATTTTGTIDVLTGLTTSYAGIIANQAGTTATTATLVKTSAGTLELSGNASTYGFQGTAGTTLTAGTLSIDAGTISGTTITSGPLGVGIVGLNGGTLLLTGGADRTLANGFNLTAASTLSSTATEKLTIDGTTLTTPTAVNLGAFVLTVNNTVQINSQITGTSGLQKAGAGTILLNNAGTTYTGATTIQNGTVKLLAADRLAIGSVLNLGTGTASGSFDLNGLNQTVTSVAIVGTGTTNQVINTGAAGAVLTLSAASTPASNILGGLGASNNFVVNKTTATTLLLSNPQTFTGGLTISGTGTTNVVDLRNPLGAGGTSTNYTNITLNGGALNARFDTNGTTFFNNIIVTTAGTGTSNAANMRIGNITASTTNPLIANFGTVTFAGAASLGMDEVGMTAGGSYQLNTTGVILNGDGTFDLGGGSGGANFARLQINGPITETGGPRSLTFNQVKTADTQFRATLTGAGSYTGNTNIGYATVFAQHVSPFGTTNSTINITNNSGILESQLDANNTFAQNVNLTTNGTLRVGRLTAGAGVASSFANLGMAATTLTVASGSNVTVDTPYALNFAGTALNGTATFAVANNGTGTGTLALGTMSGTGNILKTGAGIVTVAGGTYNGNLTLSGGNILGVSGGSLVVNNTASTALFAVGNPTTAGRFIADFKGLSNLTINYSDPASIVRVNPVNATNASGSYSTMYLPTTGAGTATITAGQLIIGDSSTNDTATGQTNQVFLSSGLTTINANTINISNNNGRDLGQLLYEVGNTTGSVKVRAQDGIGRAVLNIGTGVTGTSTGATPGNVFNVSGHSADLLFGAVTIGTQVRNVAMTSTFSFNTGTLDADSFTVGGKASDVFTTTTAGVVNIGGGTAIINNGFLVVGSNSTAFGTNNGTVNLSGGTITVGATGGDSVKLADATTAGGAANGTLNVSGTANVTLQGNIAIGTTTGTENSTVSLSGGLLNMGGNNIANVTNLNFTGGTLRNPGIINRALTQTGGTFERTTAGTSQVVGAYSASGAGTVVNVSHAAAVLDATGGLTIGTGATLKGNGTVLNAVTLTSGATLAPGNSPGTLTTGSMTWTTGANYNWQATNMSSFTPSGSNFDALTIAGTLDVQAGFNFNLWSLSGVGPDVNGNAVGFNSGADGYWIVASATALTNGANLSTANVFTTANNGTNGFTNSLGGGNFTLVVGGTGSAPGTANDVVLKFTASLAGPDLAVTTVATPDLFVLQNASLATATSLVTLTNGNGNTGTLSGFTPSNSVLTATTGQAIPATPGTVNSTISLLSTSANTTAIGATVTYLTTATDANALDNAATVNVRIGNAPLHATASPTTFGAALIAATPISVTPYTGLASNTIGQVSTGSTVPALGTTATIYNYNNSTGTDTGVSMAWRSRTAAEASSTVPGDNGTLVAGYLVSDVVNLTGMGNAGGTGFTDTFILQMSYNEALLDGFESFGVTEGNIVIAWKDGSNWVNAVNGNSTPGGTYFANQAYNAASRSLGDYGIDPTNNVVWAVLNHNSEFAVIPEPSTLVLGGLALLGFAGVGLRKRRTAKPQA